MNATQILGRTEGRFRTATIRDVRCPPTMRGRDLLPPEGGQFQYPIKSKSQNFERAAKDYGFAEFAHFSAPASHPVPAARDAQSRHQTCGIDRGTVIDLGPARPPRTEGRPVRESKP